MTKRNIGIGVVVVLVLAAVFWGMGGIASLSPRPTPTPDLTLDEFENLVTASGTLLPATRANLAFRTAGQIIAIPVKAGDPVKKGDVLARLDAAQAQAEVKVAQANLDRVQAGATKEELATVQSTVDTALAQLAKVRTGPSVQDMQIAKATLERAQSALRDAQSAYDKVKDDPAVGMFPQSQALEAAIQEYKIAEASYRKVVNGASPEDIRIAETSVAAAQAELARVQAGARPEEIAVAQAQLEQAQAGLAVMSLTAPFNSTIASVNVKEGETVTPGVPIIVLGDLSHLRLETDDLSETDIARVEIGQAVNVNFEALPGQSFSGKVTDMANMASEKQGGTNYTVTIEFDQLDPVLRWGMTGHVEISVK